MFIRRQSIKYRSLPYQLTFFQEEEGGEEEARRKFRPLSVCRLGSFYIPIIIKARRHA